MHAIIYIGEFLIWRFLLNWPSCQIKSPQSFLLYPENLDSAPCIVLLFHRLVLSAANMPYVAYSVLPYRKDEDKFKSVKYFNLSCGYSLLIAVYGESMSVGWTIPNVPVLELTACLYSLTSMWSWGRQL